jgi:hypothetical protein
MRPLRPAGGLSFASRPVRRSLAGVPDVFAGPEPHGQDAGKDLMARYMLNTNMCIYRMKNQPEQVARRVASCFVGNVVRHHRRGTGEWCFRIR